MERTGADVTEIIATLRRLQEIDKERAHLRAMEEREPKRLAEAEARAAEAEELLGQLDRDHGETQRQSSRIELDIKTKQEKIDRHRSQMLAASSNREYQSLMKELSLEEMEKARLEEELLEMMIAVDGFGERESQITREIETAKARVDTTRGEVAAALREITDRQAQLAQSRRQVTAELEPTMLRHYERLFESLGGHAIVQGLYEAPSPRTEGRYICQGCHMSLSHQMINLLILAREIVYCRSCGRILYVDESVKGGQ